MSFSVKDAGSVTAVVVFVLLKLALIGLGPLISIWALNTLFFLSIKYTIWTWLAMLWVQFITVGSVTGQLRQINKKLD